MDKKKLRNDIILVVSLLLITVVSLVIINVNANRTNLVASISVQNNVVEKVDLSRNEEKDFYIKGLKGEVHVHSKDGAIAIIESNCPHQDCVKMGYIKESNHPIICAYNAVYIVIEGQSNYDVELG
ncbi:MAG: NusG domain II-containing protein [Erysipelotrichaceae bacterium]|nr:NusG domain II-containing protein [Erysipelotrichaceae bacterium]